MKGLVEADYFRDDHARKPYWSNASGSEKMFEDTLVELYCAGLGAGHGALVEQ